MPDKLVTRGLVLRATETKEADYILTVLTAEHGRLSVIARGARRRSSRLAAACQHLAFSELVLYRRGNWYYLDEASTLTLFDGLRADLEKLSLASYFAEMTEAVTSEDLPADEVLSLLLNSLYALDALDRPNELVRAAFELKLLSLSGYEPLLADCAVCGEESPAEPLFDAMQGVVLCRKCAGPTGGVPLDAGALAAMRHIVGAPSKRLLSFTLEPASLARLSAACETFAAAQLDRRFKTLDFYKSIKLT
ncbi:DNA repair protein RecO [Oscillibacter valericigenes]|nr:DNA repair protein RecO [Oscillibacter valericigenes]